MPPSPEQRAASSSMDQKAAVQAQFGPAARNYAAPGVHAKGPDLDAMVPAARLRGDERVLDVGCGAGHTALAFAPHVARVEAFDLTQAMLDETERLARDRGITNLTTRRGDAEALPYPDGQFDRVTCRLCAHHFPAPDVAIREIARVLAPAGRVLLVDIVASEHPLLDTWLNTIELLRDPSHVRDHRPSEWHAMFAACGLKSEVVGRWSLGQAFTPWVERLGTDAVAVRALEQLFDDASPAVRTAFEIGADRRFSLQNVLFVAEPSGVGDPS